MRRKKRKEKKGVREEKVWVAQMVERQTEDLKVVSSNLSSNKGQKRRKKREKWKEKKEKKR